MDLPHHEEKSTKTKDSPSVLHAGVPTGVQVLSDSGCKDVGNAELISTTSSDSDIGTAESCSPVEFSKESIKTVLCNSNGNGHDNGTDLREKPSKNGVDSVLSNRCVETPLLATSKNKSPSVQGIYAGSRASGFDLETQAHPESFVSDNVVLGRNIDRVITKQYSPSLNRISDELQRLQQTPVNENPWEFLQSDASFSTAAGRRPASYVPRNRAHHSTYSVGIQVNNPEMGYFIHRNTQCDWIRCMMCAVIVACIITGLCAATVMILNTFFQYWLLP